MTVRGYQNRTIQELLGHSDLKTTMIYAHMPIRGAVGVKILQIFPFLGQALRPRSARETVGKLGMLCGSAYHAWQHQLPS
jgi:hypothetical protein